jgi:hypothetical protein
MRGNTKLERVQRHHHVSFHFVTSDQLTTHAVDVGVNLGIRWQRSIQNLLDKGSNQTREVHSEQPDYDIFKSRLLDEGWR